MTLPRGTAELRISASLYYARRPERSKVVLRAPNVAPRSYAPGVQVAAYTVAEIHQHAVRLHAKAASVGSACSPKRKLGETRYAVAESFVDAAIARASRVVARFHRHARRTQRVRRRTQSWQKPLVR